MSLPKYRIVYAASEVAGYAKTGGLADVAASLPRALANRGHDCILFMPLYRSARQSDLPLEPTDYRLRVSLGNKLGEGRLWKSTLPGSAVTVYLVENDRYFDREGLYQFTQPDGTKADFGDNLERFVFFSRIVMEALPLLDFWPDILMANDWQTGLIPPFLKENYNQMGRPTLRARYQSIRTLFTIHNLAYQGVFWEHDWPMLNLPRPLFNSEQMEFYGHINFLKSGIVFADAISTVSPTYAREIQTSYYGCGLQGILLRRANRLFGITNGIDPDVWNPATDPHIAQKYDIGSVTAGKTACKKALQRHFKFEENSKVPLLGMISRLASQKGLDLIEQVAPFLMQQKVQLVVLGAGDKAHVDFLTKLQKEYPTQIGVHLGYSEPLAHQIEAGADMFLMPSQYEPCGLNQLYSLRYGTVPIVRATGGLADTVVDATEKTLAEDTATGFAFVPYSAEYFFGAVQRALDLYRQQPEKWRKVQKTGMSQDWSWNHSAAEYERVFASMMSK